MKILKIKEWLLNRKHQFKFDVGYMGEGEKVAIRIKDNVTFFLGSSVRVSNTYIGYVLEFLPDMIHVLVRDDKTSTACLFEINKFEITHSKPRRRVVAKKRSP